MERSSFFFFFPLSFWCHSIQDAKCGEELRKMLKHDFLTKLKDVIWYCVTLGLKNKIHCNLCEPLKLELKPIFIYEAI